MKPLSIDLRERIVSAYEQGQGSQQALADRFNVSLSSVERLLRLKRETGSLEPKPHRSGHPPIVKEDDFTLIEEMLNEESDLIQEELAQRFTDQTGRSVSQPTISRVLRRMEITRKKKR